MRTGTWVAIGAGVLVVGVGAVGFLEHRAHAAQSSQPSSARSGVVYKPVAAGSTWGVQPLGAPQGLHLQPVKAQPQRPAPTQTVTLGFSGKPLSVSAFAGQVLAIVVPAHLAIQSITVLSQPSPLSGDPGIPQGIDEAAGGTILVTLSGYAGDIILDGIDADGNSYSALVHIVGFGKP